MAKPIINIPSPCHERWDEMTPNERGRFCNACQKTVTDYSQMSDQQLLDIIRSGSMGCGRFLNTQLNRELVPERRQWQFFSSGFIKKIAAGLLILQTITRSAWAQNNIGEILGQVVDNHKKPIIAGTVCLIQDNRVIACDMTDYNGNYSFKLLPMGHYQLKAFSDKNYKVAIVTNIPVNAEYRARIRIELGSAKANDPDTVVTTYKVPLVDNKNDRIFIDNKIDDTIFFVQGARQPQPQPMYIIDGVIKSHKPTFWQRINIFRRRHHYR